MGDQSVQNFDSTPVKLEDITEEELLPTSSSNKNTVLPEQVTPQSDNYITPDVVDATVQCMLARAHDCRNGEVSPLTTERVIVEEFLRCLGEISSFYKYR